MIAKAVRALGAVVSVGVLSGCAFSPLHLSALHCEPVQLALPDPDQTRIRQELRVLPATPGNTGRRIELLERLAGVEKDLDETSYFEHEAALAQALAIREQTGRTSDPAYARVLYRVGRLQWWRSRVELAEATLLRCRDAAQSIVGIQSSEYADCQHLLGVVYNESGRYAQAERSLRDAVDIRERLLGAKHVDYAYALFALATVYIFLGDFERAEAINLRVLAIREAALGACGRVVGDSHYSLGYIYRETGQAQRAVAAYERALMIRTAWLGKDDALTAQSMSALGVALSDMGQHAKARVYLWRSLEIRDRVLGPEHQRTVISVANIVESLRAEGKLGEAGPLLQRGLRGAFASRDPRQVWRFYDVYRAYYQQLRQPDAAIFFGKQAVNTIQRLRAQLADLDRGLQRSFLQNKNDVYRNLADLLIDQGRLPEAQQVLSMLKEEEFFDYVRRDTSQENRSSQIAYTAAEEVWPKRYAEISGRLGEIGTALDELDRKARVGLSDEERAQREKLRADRSVAHQVFDAFLGELNRELGRADPQRNREIGARNLENLRALQGTLGALGHGAVALHYVMGETKLRILLTTPSIQIARSTDVKAGELNQKIARLQSQLKDPRLNPMPMARELYRLLVAPIAEDLKQVKAQTLMVSLDGALRYIPVAALHDGNRYLIEDYRIAIFTEAAKDKIKDTPQTAWRVAGLGLTRQVEGFSALPAVRQELEGIIKSGGKGVLPGELHFDQDFTAENIRRALEKAYPVLHIASHFVFRPGIESNSFLLLGDGNRLTLNQLKTGDYQFKDIDLITLSACETAVGGGKDANGMEIEGFGALAQQQGARGVIATLWPVADASTGMLMQNLYRLREADKLTKAEALRQAQLMLLRGAHPEAEQEGAVRGLQSAESAKATNANRPYAHPFFWAPFILMGNWL